MTTRLPLVDKAIPLAAAFMGATFGAVTEASSAVETVLGGAFIALITASAALLVTGRVPLAAVREGAQRALSHGRRRLRTLADGRSRRS